VSTGVNHDQRRPARVALSNDFELLLAGMEAVLAPYADRVQVIDMTVGDEVRGDADVILFDTFGTLSEHIKKLQKFLSDSPARVLVYSWEVFPAERALDEGAYGYVFKGCTALELVEAIEAVHAGRRVVPSQRRPKGEHLAGDWPGKAAGLTSREAEILTLVVAGHSNAEIAAASYLSINTIKTHLRSTYRKIGVSRRAQAVAWGIRNGMAPQ
jgi:NarL family two-component system response regulator LiaR